MIPGFDDNGLLPPGIHRSTWEEFSERFGGNPRRRELLQGIEKAMANLREAGCQTLYIDGSFVTDKAVPGDFDGCWDWREVDPDRVDPILFEFADGRAAQKRKYGGELFEADGLADGAGTVFLDFFQRTRDGVPKGIVALDLRAES